MHNFKKVGIFVGGTVFGIFVGGVGMIRMMLNNDTIRSGGAKEVVRRIVDGDKRRDRYDELKFDTETEATKTLANAQAILDKYGSVTVADVYDMAGITTVYLDCLYGWTDLRKAEIVKSTNGYVLRMPESKKLTEKEN